MPRKELIELSPEIPDKTLDATLKAMVREGTVQREDRKETEGRGRKQAFYRRNLETKTNDWQVTR